MIAVLDLVGLFSHIDSWSIWPEYISVDICSVLSATASIFTGVLLIRLHLDKMQRGQKDEPDQSVTVHVLPEEGAAEPVEQKT